MRIPCIGWAYYWPALASVALIVPGVAHASLGGSADSVATDQHRMAVRQHGVAQAAAGVRHTLSLTNGGEVREYVNASGVVYAVRWSGPGKPDLESLLGDHFATFQAANPGGARHGLRRPPMVNQSTLKVVAGGRPGAFWGYAWLPQNAPAGFDPSTL
jgi:hypothetical protein